MTARPSALRKGIVLAALLALSTTSVEVVFPRPAPAAPQDLRADTRPGVLSAPTIVDAAAYAAPGGSTHLHTANRRNRVSAKGTGSGGGTVRHHFEFHTSTAGTAATLKATCTSAASAPGTQAGCRPTADLPDDTAIVVRARTSDGVLHSAWSAWSLFRVGAATPAAPTITCPYANGSWHDTPPSENVTCTITAPGNGFSAPGYVRVTVDGRPQATNFTGGAPGQLKIVPSADPNVAKATITVPNSQGLHTIRAQAETPAGTLSAAADHGFGYGGSTLTSPAASPHTTTTGAVRISASGPPHGGSAPPTATVRWRLAGYGGTSETTGWNTAASAPLTVTDNGAAGVTVSGTWDAAAETRDGLLDADPNTAGIQATPLDARVPALMDVQVCLTYSASTRCTWSQSRTTVLRVPHAFGDGFPTAEAGPGQVALWTGEFHTEATDISAPGYAGDLTVSRSHSTFAGATDAVNGVFGPGWTARFDGAEAGVAGMRVVDNTRLDGTIALIDGEGSALVYSSPTGIRRTGANLGAGTWVAADEETSLDAGKLTVAGTGAATTIAHTDDEGTITTFTTSSAPTFATAGKFRPGSISEAGSASRTTYSYDPANGRVTRIVAPSAPGVTCVDGQGRYTNAVGCRSVRFDYGTTGSATGRLVAAWLDIYRPDKPGGAGMDSIKVMAYTYDSAGRLATATDQRNNLGTTYGYDSANRLTSVKPAGKAPFQFGYVTAPQVKLASVRRDRPEGGTATLASFVYDVPVTGPGLPDPSGGSVARWNQVSAPQKGFAVFGPDHPVTATTPSGIAAGDWEHAALPYTDDRGHTVNTRTVKSYAPVVAGDGDGWALGTPVSVSTGVDLNGAPSPGDVVAGTKRTVRYTVAASAAHPECGAKPQWAGLVCKTYPAVGPALPTTTTTAYDYRLEPTTVVETSGSVTRAETTIRLPDGRVAWTETAVAGSAVSTKEYEYDANTGELTKVTARGPDGSVVGTVTASYDSWGRRTS
ncbi:hypothetical protein GCM10011609_26380 [Lentzea pudingi]|uniref:DUF6531 domain-containing protein n=1 Tax=Lentzea pudingi TaxID=1789439 RepID=A0ABQ2HR22_9PSEU|nr:RHS repeat domain-containing protein [Lentzea pudingi]GGM88344.1 hypothetical protein GCM10011609_26380 [Lentzea pudingi]